VTTETSVADPRFLLAARLAVLGGALVRARHSDRREVAWKPDGSIATLRTFT
jgi:hypothetical protein